jgi:hypothetical protein
VSLAVSGVWSCFMLIGSSAASAIAANTFLRSCLAAGFPLFARQMFDNLGIEWAATLLGCVAAVCVPIPICFYFFGKKLRQKSKFAPTMQIKKPVDEESTGDDEEGEHDANMAALHATRSRAHHDLEVRSRRVRTNGSQVTTPSAPGADSEKTQDPEKRAS